MRPSAAPGWPSTAASNVPRDIAITARNEALPSRSRW
jgi:hypothetical protein